MTDASRAGKRKCIGDSFARTEMMITAAAILTRWQLAPLPGTTVTETKVMATLQPKGLRMVALAACPVP